MRKNQKKVHAAKACKDGSALQWLAEPSDYVTVADASECKGELPPSQDNLTIEHSEQAFIQGDVAFQTNPREDLKSKFAVWESSGQAKPDPPPSAETKSDLMNLKLQISLSKNV